MTRTQPSTGGGSSPPLGVLLVAGLGILSAVFDVLGGVGALGAGPVGFFGGTVGIALAVGQIVTLLALLRMRRWAWTVTLVVIGLNALVSLVTLSPVSLLLDLLVGGYLFSVGEKFD
ncbi:hypothetical protein RYH80_02480 [Halobaculum sp. MBLA0147]|uniref:hypothetical protein n=1 Tax=Halobaculum sp. MBLA0147 TaxID=3079934 RepID=UPI00352468A6